MQIELQSASTDTSTAHTSDAAAYTTATAGLLLLLP
jgi:hypothetical protein